MDGQKTNIKFNKKRTPKIVPMGTSTNTYVINGTKYIVEHNFAPLTKDNRVFLKNKLTKIVVNEIAPLTENRGSGNMSDRYMCPTAGEEVKCSQTN